MAKGTKTIVFIILFVILWIPMIQKFSGLIQEPRLNGAFVKTEKPVFSIDGLKSFEFQKQFEKYQNENFGFRSLLVKIKNSLEYIFFKELNVEDNVSGKNGLIFSRVSLCRTTGLLYNGKEQNMETVERIRFMKDGLKNHGVQLITGFAPSKEMVFPTYMPLEYITQFKRNSDYLDLLSGLRKSGIPTIDLASFFYKMKDTTAYPLFTKTGFHWSAYHASFAQDSLIHFLSKLTEPMPEYERTGSEWCDTARDSDADFEKPLNLLFPIGQPSYLYPKYKMVSSTLGRKRPKVIIIGDSFFWQIKDQKNLMHVFSDDSKFWYYFASTSFPLSDAHGVPMKDLNIMQELESADFVILFGSMGTLDRFPFGVSDYYHDHFNQQTEINNGITAYLSNHKALSENLSENVKNNSLQYNRLEQEQALRISRDKKDIVLKTSNGKFVSVDAGKNSGVFADKERASTWETLSLIPLGDNKYALASFENKFLSAEIKGNTQITANRLTIDDWEVFTMIWIDKTHVALKAFNGKYIHLDKGVQQLFANSNTIGETEKFELIEN